VAEAGGVMLDAALLTSLCVILARVVAGLLFPKKSPAPDEDQGRVDFEERQREFNSWLHRKDRP